MDSFNHDYTYTYPLDFVYMWKQYYVLVLQPRNKFYYRVPKPGQQKPLHTLLPGPQANSYYSCTYYKPELKLIPKP